MNKAFKLVVALLISLQGLAQNPDSQSGAVLKINMITPIYNLKPTIF